MTDLKQNRVAIVGGARTPFAKARTALKEYSALELGAHSVDGVLEKTGLEPAKVDELAYGSDHVLADIGLSRAEIGQGPAESFWRM